MNFFKQGCDSKADGSLNKKNTSISLITETLDKFYLILRFPFLILWTDFYHGP